MSCDLASGDMASTYLWSKVVRDGIEQTTHIIKHRPNGETRNPLGCWATYANNNSIPHPCDNNVGITGNI